MTELLFSDAWFKAVWQAFNPAEYTVAIALLVGLFKAWAVKHPDVPTNKILDLLKLVVKR